MPLTVSSWPDVATHPGEVLADLLPEHGLTAATLAERSGLATSAIEDLLRGARSVDDAMARRLGAAFGVSAEFWTNLQEYFDGVVMGVGRAPEFKRTGARRIGLLQAERNPS